MPVRIAQCLGLFLILGEFTFLRVNRSMYRVVPEVYKERMVLIILYKRDGTVREGVG